VFVLTQARGHTGVLSSTKLCSVFHALDCSGSQAANTRHVQLAFARCCVCVSDVAAAVMRIANTF
jgi:hypothetical protein